MALAAEWVESRHARRGLIRFERVLRDVAESAGAPLRQVHRDGVLQSGKRVRPLLVLVAGELGREAARGRLDATLDVALAVELAHAGTLYHDDIADGASMRRGAPAVHARYGCRVAALAGAHLLYLANRLIGKRGPALGRIWAEAAGRVCEGQLREIEDIGDVAMSPRRYLTHAYLKTASLFEFAARAGAEVANADARVARTLARFARSYGLLFQIVDDVADLFSRPEESGRESDMRLGIYNLPVVLALRKPCAADLGRLLAGSPIPHPRPVVAEARRSVLALGGVEDALAVATRWAVRARIACSDLPGGPARDSLLRLIACTLQRGRAIAGPRAAAPVEVHWSRTETRAARRGTRPRTVLPGRLLGTMDFLNRCEDDGGGGWRIGRLPPGGSRVSFRGERSWLAALLEQPPDAPRSAVALAAHAGERAREVLGRFSGEGSAAGLASRRDRVRWSFGTARLAVADALIARGFGLLADLQPPERERIDALMVESFAGALDAAECVRRGADRVPGSRRVAGRAG